MDGAKLLFIAALVVAAFLAVTAAIIAIAPYVAIIVIVGAILAWVSPKGDPGE
jgi:hypothetical protein